MTSRLVSVGKNYRRMQIWCQNEMFLLKISNLEQFIYEDGLLNLFFKTWIERRHIFDQKVIIKWCGVTFFFFRLTDCYQWNLDAFSFLIFLTDIFLKLHWGTPMVMASMTFETFLLSKFVYFNVCVRASAQHKRSQQFVFKIREEYRNGVDERKSLSIIFFL